MQLIYNIIQAIFNWLGDLAKWLMDLFLYLPRLFVSEAVDALIWLYSSVTGLVPVESLSFGGIPAGVLYFLDPFRLDLGIPMILAAYAIRFIIRRIPVIG